jgi:hypothetical protein
MQVECCLNIAVSSPSLDNTDPPSVDIIPAPPRTFIHTFISRTLMLFRTLIFCFDLNHHVVVTLRTSTPINSTSISVFNAIRH